MRRRDFLTLCAAAVGCAAASVKSEEHGTTLRVIDDIRWNVPSGGEFLIYNGTEWAKVYPGETIAKCLRDGTPMTFRAAQPRHSA